MDAVILSAVRTAVAKGKADGALAKAGVLPIDITTHDKQKTKTHTNNNNTTNTWTYMLVVLPERARMSAQRR